MCNYDERLGEARTTLCKRVYRPGARDPRLPGTCKRLESVDVDPSRELLPVAEENGNTE
jgi:hypothetical protein